jgi:hypothetical protein
MLKALPQNGEGIFLPSKKVPFSENKIKKWALPY